MARLFIDGFESGQDDLWDAESNATVVSSAGLDMDGDYCLDLNDITEYLQKTIVADEMYFAVLYRGTTLSYRSGIISVLYNGTNLCEVIKQKNTGVVTAYRDYTEIAASTKVLSNNTTYLVEVRIKIHDSAGRVEVKVDGVQCIDFTGDTKPGADTQFNQARIGSSGTLVDIYSFAYFDNFIMDDAAWIGDTSIQAIVPTAGGNSTGWAASAGSNFACVDEIPASDVDYVSVNANNVVDSYITGDLVGSIDNIKCVQVQSRTRSEGSPTPNNLKLVVRRGSTDYLSGDKTVPVAEKSLYSLWATDPSTSVAWLESGVNAAEIGVKSAA